MKIFVRPLFVGALITGVLCNAAPAWSQAEPAPLQTRKAYEIPVANVPAHLLAWWLDSANQPRPAEMGFPVPGEAVPISRPANEKPSPFDLPAGIDKIVADDAQKRLLVFGEEAAVQKLRKTVAFLDQPRRQVELETHIVFMKPEDFQAFGLSFAPPTMAHPATPGTTPLTSLGLTTPTTNWLTLLTERTRTSQMSELAIPRITTYDNMNATLDVPRSHPLPVDLQNKLSTLVPQGATDAPLELQTPLKVTLTPTINNDGTVTVLLNLKGQAQLAHKGSSDALTLGNPSGIMTIANVRDGDTIALTGYDPTFTSTFVSPTIPQNVPMLSRIPIGSNLLPSKQPLSGEMVVFLTPRIVRHPAP